MPEVEEVQCHTSVERLKRGPVNYTAIIQENLNSSKVYFDTSFYGNEALFWPTFTSQSTINKLLDLINRGRVEWESWKSVYPNSTVYNESITWSDAN